MQAPASIWPSTARSGKWWPAWFSFWFSGRWRTLAKGTAWAGLLSNSSSASFCIAERSRTVFLCSEKEGTARGARGRFFRCGRFCDDITKNRHNKLSTATHNTHTRRRNARRSLTMGITCDLQRSPWLPGGPNARTRDQGRRPKTKEGPPTRAPLATPFQDTADGSEDSGNSGRTGHGGFESHSFCTRRVKL